MNSFIFKLYGIAALVFVPLAVVINLAHPFLHGLEGGSLDLMLPYINMMAAATGGGKLVEWATGRSHRNHDHDDGCPFEDVRPD